MEVNALKNMHTLSLKAETDDNDAEFDVEYLSNTVQVLTQVEKLTLIIRCDYSPNPIKNLDKLITALFLLKNLKVLTLTIYCSPVGEKEAGAIEYKLASLKNLKELNFFIDK